MTRETKSQLIAARAHERARLLQLIERWESCHEIYAQMEREDQACEAGKEPIFSTAELAKTRKDIYAEVVLALRAALRLELQPTAAKPGSEP